MRSIPRTARTSNLVSQSALINKLNRTCWAAMESAAEACERLQNASIETEHVLTQLLAGPDNDVHAMLRAVGIQSELIVARLTSICDSFHRGSSAHPRLSASLVQLLTDSWSLGSIEFGAETIRSGHLLVTYLWNPDYSSPLVEACPELRAVDRTSLMGLWPTIIGTSAELSSPLRAINSPPKQVVNVGDLARSSSPFLDKFTSNLTDSARRKQIDPVLGRDSEINQVIDILLRRRQNNPILTGDAGVGKTAIVEGFAQRIACGDVPRGLRDVQLRALDLGLLQAGASAKGEFEERLKSLIAEIKSAVAPVVLFIDEAHTIIGAGGTPGQNDAANLLKPALARGELRTVAATTWTEYAKYFEKDAALTRRFQVVKVDEPTAAGAIVMVRGLTATLERHHGVEIRDEAVESAVLLSQRYLSGRQMPDKCVSVLDTACARVATSHSADPSALRQAGQDLLAVEGELAAVLRPINQDEINQNERRSTLAARRDALKKLVAGLNSRVDLERELLAKVLALRASRGTALVTGAAESPGGEGELGACGLRDAEMKLRAFQGEAALVRPDVDKHAIAEVISDWTGVPLKQMLADEYKALLDLH